MFNDTHVCFMKKINGMMVVVITALFGIFCGCSQEDDGYDNADMYTLAEMGTRLGGKGDPGGSTKKKKISFVYNGNQIPHPRKTSNTTEPVLDGEYDSTELVVFISDFSGHVESYLRDTDHHVWGYAQKDVLGEDQIGFSLTNCPTGTSYEVIVVLESDAYIGEFDL